MELLQYYVQYFFISKFRWHLPNDQVANGTWSSCLGCNPLWKENQLAFRQCCYALQLLEFALCTISGLDSGDLTIPGLGVAFAAVFLAVFQKGLTTHVIQHSEVKLSPLQLLDSCMPWMGAITVISAVALEDVSAASQQISGRALFGDCHFICLWDLGQRVINMGPWAFLSTCPYFAWSDEDDLYPSWWSSIL